MHRTDLGRRAWHLTRTSQGVRARGSLLATALVAAVVLVGTALAGHAVLGRLGDPFALIVALPAFAHALAAFGLRDLLAQRIAAVRTGERRLLAAFGLWLATSALLTLDVAAVAAGSVSMAIGRDRGERRWQLGAAVVGSNVGSLLFPFSNPVNLVLVAGSGLGLAAYLGAAVPAAIAAAVAGGALLLGRFVQDQDADRDEGPAAEDPPLRYDPRREAGARGVDQASILAASLAGAVAVVSVVSGLTGGSMVWPFVAGSAIIAGWSITVGRLDPVVLRRSVPVGAVAVIVGAALLAGPIGGLAAIVPGPRDASAVTLISVALLGAILAAMFDTLAAAAFGAAWLGVASPVLIVAYLVGTNVGSIATPHGSVATVLARSSARWRRSESGLRAYLAGAWRYAAVTAAAALVALALIR